MRSRPGHMLLSRIPSQRDACGAAGLTRNLVHKLQQSIKATRPDVSSEEVVGLLGQPFTPFAEDAIWCKKLEL
jgi:hypothetical protein